MYIYYALILLIKRVQLLLFERCIFEHHYAQKSQLKLVKKHIWITDIRVMEIINLIIFLYLQSHLLQSKNFMMLIRGL